MILAELADADAMVDAKGLWPAILQTIWQDPTLRAQLLARIGALFWTGVWPTWRTRRVLKVVPVRLLEPLFVELFGPKPAHA